MWGWRLEDDDGCLTSHSLPQKLRQDLSLNPELAGLASWTAPAYSRDFLSLPPMGLDYSLAGFYVDSGDLNANPHLYMTSTSCTEPPPQLLLCICEDRIGHVYMLHKTEIHVSPPVCL